jgi:methyl-accepting chemotaxis protein
MGRPYVRRRLFVHPVQYRLLAANIVYGLALILVIGIPLFAPLVQELQSPDLSLPEKGRVAEQFLTLHQRLWPWLFPAFALIAFHSVFFVHRIGGPLYRFTRLFQALAQGDDRARALLRRHDYLKPEADAFNAMLDRMSERTLRLQTQTRDAREAFESLARAAQDGDRAQIGGACDAVRARLALLQSELDRPPREH